MGWLGTNSPLPFALMFAASSFAQNAQTVAPGNAPNSEESCPAKSLLLNFDFYRAGELAGQLPIWHLQDDSAFFFSAGMAIDADGAPNAYNADNTGLDDLSNAGSAGHWDGILQDSDGNPLVQGPDDPYPGFYISCTALADWAKDRFDPARFVDASKIPYISLPGELARATGARLGDIAVVFNLRNGKSSSAIFADIGTPGEGSIALANSLGIWSDARRGGSRGGLVYLVFPGSGDHRPKTVDEINQLGARLLEEWGGVEQFRSCDRYQSGGQPAWPRRYAGWDRPSSDPAKPALPERKPSLDTASTAAATDDHADTAHADTD